MAGPGWKRLRIACAMARKAKSRRILGQCPTKVRGALADFEVKSGSVRELHAGHTLLESGKPGVELRGTVGTCWGKFGDLRIADFCGEPVDSVMTRFFAEL